MADLAAGVFDGAAGAEAIVVNYIASVLEWLLDCQKVVILDIVSFHSYCASEAVLCV